MNTSEIIKNICRDKGISFSELARRTGQVTSTLTRKIARNSMTLDEFQKCLAAIGATCEFEIKDSTGREFDVIDADDRAMERIQLLEAQLELDKKNIEYQRKLARDIRTELESIIGYTSLAASRINEPEEAMKCLNDAENTFINIEKMIAYSIGESEIEVASEDENEYALSVVKGKRILIIDDNEMNREILQEVLEENGLLTESATNGKDAIDMYLEKDPGYYNYILMDLEMPVMDGYEATKRIRHMSNRMRAAIPIIALTANATREDKHKAIKAGIDDYLVKPINASRLMNVLARYI